MTSRAFPAAIPPAGHMTQAELDALPPPDCTAPSEQRPVQPEGVVWYRGWEAGQDDMAMRYTDESWIAYKGGCDLDAPQLCATSWTALLDLIDDEETPAEPPLPRRLSSDVNHKDFHPSWDRIGVRLNGVEQTKVIWYDRDAGAVQFTESSGLEPLFGQDVQPYWKFPESRQMRRARERWEAKHGRKP